MPLIYVQRELWDTGKTLPRLGSLVAPSARTHVFIHHTVMVDSDATKNTWESWDEIRAMMQRLQVARPDLGKDVPYSFVAFCHASGDLVLCEGRGLLRTGAHSVGHNTAAFGISFAGDFENQPAPTQLANQLAALGIWLKSLRQIGYANLGTVKPPIPKQREVFAHEDIKATACPGRHLVTMLPAIRYAT